MTLRLLMFAEALADFRRASVLVDRALAEQAPWVSDLLSVQETHASQDVVETRRGVRVWIDEHGEPRDEAFLDVHHLDAITKRLRKAGGFRLSRGHFDGEPGKDSAKMGRKVLDVAEQLHHVCNVSAVLIVIDMDEQPERKEGLSQARGSSSRGFVVVLGCPDECMEAWVLAAFQPGEEGARERWQGFKATSPLNFDPCEQAHRLSHKEGGPRSAKAVVEALFPEPGSDLEALRRAPLDLLRSRGHKSGLSAFVEEVRAKLCPLLCP